VLVISRIYFLGLARITYMNKFSLHFVIVSLVLVVAAFSQSLCCVESKENIREEFLVVHFLY
jgi:hypothetical protein